MIPALTAVPAGAARIGVPGAVLVDRSGQRAYEPVAPPPPVPPHGCDNDTCDDNGGQQNSDCTNPDQAGPDCDDRGGTGGGPATAEARGSFPGTVTTSIG